MSNIGLTIVAVGILVSSWLTPVAGTGHQPREGETEAERAVKQLGSTDPAVQESAKKELYRLGPSAVTALLVALNDATQQQNRGYLPEDYERVKALRRMQIPLYEVLGKLKVAEAVPLLIQAMETRPQDSGSERCHPDIEALVKIGQPSVLPLIRSLENAEATYYRNKNVITIPVLITAIKVRAAGALGDIGDIAALPALEKVDNEIKDYTIWLAIQRIKKQNSLPYERASMDREPEPFCRGPISPM